MTREEYDRHCHRLWQCFDDDDDLAEMLTQQGGLMDFIAYLSETFGDRELQFLTILENQLTAFRKARESEGEDQ